MADGDDLVVLTDASGTVEAGAIRAFLEDNEIFVYVQGEHHSSLLGAVGAIAIGMNIMVPRSQLARAAELLEAYRHAEPIDPFEDDDPDPELPEARVVKRRK